MKMYPVRAAVAASICLCAVACSLLHVEKRPPPPPPQPLAPSDWYGMLCARMHAKRHLSLPTIT